MDEPLGNDSTFRERRERGAVCFARFQGGTLPMILRHEDVMSAAKNWERFSSDAPFRVPVP